jgi:hypothetical protein
MHPHPLVAHTQHSFSPYHSHRCLSLISHILSTSLVTDIDHIAPRPLTHSPIHIPLNRRLTHVTHPHHRPPASPTPPCTLVAHTTLSTHITHPPTSRIHVIHSYCHPTALPNRVAYSRPSRMSPSHVTYSRHLPSPSHSHPHQPPTGTGDAPEFAWFHTQVDPTPAGKRLVSALAFVTAEGPLNIAPYGCCGEELEGTKVMSALYLC